MKPKQIIILGVILAILLVIAFAKKLFVKPEVESTEYKSLDISLDFSTVHAVEMKKGQDKKPLRLEKKNGNWIIPSKWNVGAQEKKIETLVKGLSELEGELRSSSEELLSDYGISDGEAFSIDLLGDDGESVLKLLLGKKKTGAGSSFVRKDKSAEVYLVNKDIFPLLQIFKKPEEANVDADKWVDLKALQFDVEKVQSLRIVKHVGKQEIVPVDIKKELDEKKNLKHWVDTGGEAIFDIDATKIRNSLRRMSNIYTKKAVAPHGDKYGFENPFISISLGTEEGTEEVLVGGTVNKDTGERYMRTPQGHTYIITKSTLQRIDIDNSKFFINNPLRVDKNRIVSLTIRSGKKRITLDKDLIEKNTSYINKLKQFRVKTMLFEGKYARGLKSSVKHSLKITKEDKDVLTLRVKQVDEGKFIAQIGEKEGVFTISKNVFQKIFEGLDKLKLEKQSSKKN